MPNELSRKNFKAIQREVEQGNKFLLDAVAKPSNAASPVATLDSMITRMNNLKRKLETLHNEELTIQRHSRARLEHLNDLYQIPSLADVKYEEWSRIRLNRLLVDYLLRNGYEQSARELAKEKGIEDLVDVEAFVSCHKIEQSLLQGRAQEALSWCTDNKRELKKINVGFSIHKPGLNRY
jgi:macrophage erythroblast attacher